MLAVAVLIICGSLFLAVAFPGAAYFNSLKEIIDEYGVETINEHGLGQIDRMALLCGITNQSQCLAPLSAVTAIWVLCDLLFVEKRLAVLHLVILVGAMPLVYMTRSRCALLATCAGVTMVVMYGFRFVSLDRQVKRKLISGMLALSSLVAIAVVVVELRDNSISKWIRKTDDVKGDTRTVSEAFTESRQGMVAKNMYDFYRNPLWGSGFQVEYDFQYRYPRDKIVLSAPIEKGVLPLMVLGEAGVAGALVFFCFVVTFYFKCTQRRYVATAILFTVFFASNLGEATFFSTGGSGGICWIMSIVGGFAIDMITLKGARLQRQLAAW